MASQGPWEDSNQPVTTRPRRPSLALLQMNVLNRCSWVTRDELRTAIRNLDRKNQPPPPKTSPPRAHEIRQIRTSYEHACHSGGVTRKWLLSVEQSPMLRALCRFWFENVPDWTISVSASSPPLTMHRSQETPASTSLNFRFN